MFKDYYKILGITRQASTSEIKSAYRAMSMKWHPDRNPGVDVTAIMQDINEAYAILKDEDKRRRYDEEYDRFIRQYHDDLTLHEENGKDNHESADQNHSSRWEYDYDIQDETLKEDIKTARQYAKELVEEFLTSFKDASKNAAKGAWSGAKGYVYVAIIMTLIGVVIKTCHSTNEQDVVSYSEFYEPIDSFNAQVNEEIAKLPVPIKILPSFTTPENWTKYTIDNNAFSISVPNTVELRHEYDSYTRQLQELGFACNSDRVVFQQKGLSHKKKDAYNHYCRIIILHTTGNAGDFFHSYEAEYIDYETKSFLRDLVLSELGPAYKLLDEPDYEWICIGTMNAIEIKYRRSGSKENTTACTMYLLFNYDEMVKMIVSYREQEKDIWLPDLDNVIRTFKWN